MVSVEFNFCKTLKRLKNKEYVVIPTETMPSLSADPRHHESVDKIRTLKRRSATQPFSLLTPSIDFLKPFVTLSSLEMKMLSLLWPGPFTFVLQARDEELALQVGSQDGTIGVRQSSHPFVQRVLNHWKYFLTTTSVNRSGEESKHLGSTILKVEKEKIHLLREGLHSPVLKNIASMEKWNLE